MLAQRGVCGLQHCLRAVSCRRVAPAPHTTKPPLQLQRQRPRLHAAAGDGHNRSRKDKALGPAGEPAQPQQLSASDSTQSGLQPESTGTATTQDAQPAVSQQAGAGQEQGSSSLTSEQQLTAAIDGASEPHQDAGTSQPLESDPDAPQQEQYPLDGYEAYDEDQDEYEAYDEDEDEWEEDDDLVPGYDIVATVWGTEGVLPEVSAQDSRLSGILYFATATAFFLQGVGMLAAAHLKPSLLLPALADGAQGQLLLGCAAVAYLQASALLIHMLSNLVAEELATWRHQRQGFAIAIFSLLCLISGLVAAPTAHLTMTLVQCGTGVLGLVTSGVVLSRLVQYQPWAQWTINPTDLGATRNQLWALLKRDLSSFAGVMCLLWVLLAGGAAVDILMNPDSWTGWGTALGGQLHMVYPFATSHDTADAWDGLRRVCGAGLLVSMMVAHSLLEKAQYVRLLSLLDFVKQSVVVDQSYKHPLVALMAPRPERYRFLAVAGAVLPALLQLYILVTAPEMGVDVNVDTALMGPLHWTTGTSLLFGLACATQFDWTTAYRYLYKLAAFIGGFTSWVAQTFYLRLDWTRIHRT